MAITESYNWDRENRAHFLEFVGMVLPYSFSQRFQDLWALWESGFKVSGYFVEFGALNGRDFSNSYILERLGWSGVVAEPHPDFHKFVRRNRSCTVSTKCVYTETGINLTFNAVKGRPALSSISGFGNADDKKELRENFVAYKVETVSLHDLLSESGAPPVIDFLSIDTEGSEFAILNSFDFKPYLIKSICVEHNAHQRDAIYRLLTSKGYFRKWEQISGHDDWYVLPDAASIWSCASTQSLVDQLCDQPTFDNSLAERSTLLDSLIKSHATL